VTFEVGFFRVLGSSESLEDPMLHGVLIEYIYLALSPIRKRILRNHGFNDIHQTQSSAELSFLVNFVLVGEVCLQCRLCFD